MSTRSIEKNGSSIRERALEKNDRSLSFADIVESGALRGGSFRSFSTELPFVDQNLLKAVYLATTGFSFFDSQKITYSKVLRVFLDATGSSFGFIAEVKERNPDPPSVQIFSVLDPDANIPHDKLHQNFETFLGTDNDIVNVINDALTYRRICHHASEVLQDSDKELLRVFQRQRSGNSHVFWSCSHFAAFPLFKPVKPSERSVTLCGIVGVGRHSAPYSPSFCRTFHPLSRVVETLLESWSLRSGAPPPSPDRQQEIMALIARFKNPETGIAVKDRKHHLKTFKQCFVGKEAVTWLVNNAGHLGVKSRQDAVVLGNKMMLLNAFSHVTRGHIFEDEMYFYTLSKDVDPSDPPLSGSPSSPGSDSLSAYGGTGSRPGSPQRPSTPTGDRPRSPNNSTHHLALSTTAAGSSSGLGVGLGGSPLNASAVGTLSNISSSGSGSGFGLAPSSPSGGRPPSANASPLSQSRRSQPAINVSSPSSPASPNTASQTALTSSQQTNVSPPPSARKGRDHRSSMQVLKEDGRVGSRNSGPLSALSSLLSTSGPPPQTSEEKEKPPARSHRHSVLLSEAGSRKSLTLSAEHLTSMKEMRDAAKYQLHQIVAQRDHAALKKALTKKKVIDHLNVTNEDNQTALHLAIENNDQDSVEILLAAYKAHANKVDINVADKNGYAPLHCASYVGNVVILMGLLNYPGIRVHIKNTAQNTPLHTFCGKWPNPTSMKELLDEFVNKGAVLNDQNDVGETPLHKALLNPLVRLLMVRLLLERNADANIANFNGETPLHYAIHLNRRDIVFALLGAGADPNLKGDKAKSPLEVAEQEASEEVISLIRETLELSKWLTKMKLIRFLPLLVNAAIFLDTLHILDETALQEMGIEKAGDRFRLLNAIQELMDEQQMRSEESSDTSPMHTMSPSPSMWPHRGQKMLPHERVRIPSPKQDFNYTLRELEEIKSKLRGSEVNWITYTELEFTEVLGGGTSGNVYRGRYNNQEVAIKVLEKEKEGRLAEFKHEFKIMSEIQGPNVLRFYGACVEPKPCLVMELCSLGSLYDILNNEKYEIGWPEVMRFAKEIAQAVHLLHSNEPQILHRDLKSMNFLVTDDWSLKVCDFGLSRFRSTTNIKTFTKLRGTMCYCAPETFDALPYTTKSDIYSVGIMVWEMVYRCVYRKYQRPFEEFKYISQPIQVIVLAAHSQLRPTIPDTEHLPRAIARVITECWDPDPGKRPETPQLLEMLAECRAELQAHPDEWSACIVPATPGQ